MVHHERAVLHLPGHDRRRRRRATGCRHRRRGRSRRCRRSGSWSRPREDCGWSTQVAVLHFPGHDLAVVMAPQDVGIAVVVEVAGSVRSASWSPRGRDCGRRSPACLRCAATRRRRAARPARTRRRRRRDSRRSAGGRRRTAGRDAGRRPRRRRPARQVDAIVRTIAGEDGGLSKQKSDYGGPHARDRRSPASTDQSTGGSRCCEPAVRLHMTQMLKREKRGNRLLCRGVGDTVRDFPCAKDQ